MKRILSLMLIAIMLCGSCWALGDTHSQYVYTYTVRNNAGTPKIQVVPVTSIRPGVDKLVGYAVLPITTLGTTSTYGTENYLTLYDATSSDAIPNLTGLEVIGEIEAAANTAAYELWPIPKSFTTGIIMQQGCYTQAIIYFIKE